MNETLFDEYVNKVFLIADTKYKLEDVIMESYLEQIEKCYNNGFSPIRTVEFIAERIFS